MPATDWRWMPALDLTDLHAAERVVSAVGRHPAVEGFKIGFALGLAHGLPAVMAMIRRHSDRPVIYDHQKAATDIPDTGRLFARTLAEAGIDGAILVPQAGPATLDAWITALAENGRQVIVGGLMTHPAYRRSEGGYLDDDAPATIYRRAIERGVTGFVVPMTKPAAVAELVATVAFPATSVFYSPGFGAQGGDPATLPGPGRLVPIVGRALLQAEDPLAWLEQTIATWRHRR